jgi:bifunctional UDP-N-acetylglucosamine pyrophosphorylase/glucosamine-1-phosphate N-acetyltransferase
MGEAIGGRGNGRRAVVVLAAGHGKRMKSALPKVLHPVLGEPILAHVLRTAWTLRPDKLVVVVGVGREQVEAFVQALPVPAGCVAPQCLIQEQQLGSGHALQAAEPGWRDCDEVVALSGDVPMLQPGTLAALTEARGEARCSLLVTDLAEPGSYGRVIGDGHGRVTRIVEHKDATETERAIRTINAGLYAFAREFLHEALPRLRNDNAQGEYYVTDLVGLAAAHAPLPVAVPVADPAEVAGINNRLELAQATAELRRRTNESWLLQGVGFDDPATAWVEATVALEPDCRIGAAVELRGTTAVAAGAVVHRGCVLTNTAVAAGAEVLPYTVATDAAIGPGAHVGPFAHLRPGTVLADHVKVGNFVETKKARIGPHAKASHLSYLGDCDIGARSNVGAGTITCNYDGVDKHKTVLGEGVFIGSDTQLVAPVTLGDGAYVGAGSTVTQDVPAGALALSRVQQVNVAGWVGRNEAKRAARKAAK